MILLHLLPALAGIGWVTGSLLIGAVRGCTTVVLWIMAAAGPTLAHELEHLLEAYVQADAVGLIAVFLTTAQAGRELKVVRDRNSLPLEETDTPSSSYQVNLATTLSTLLDHTSLTCRTR
jgi:hypothetical protein